MNDLNRTVEAFLYREARLMDENRYEEWLSLFAEECRYWIPSNRADADPDRAMSILNCDRSSLESHVHRLAGGKAFAQSPPSRMRRVIGNVEVATPTGREAAAGDVLEATATFIVVELRRHVQRVHAGQSRYRLEMRASDLVIRYKQVNLLGMDEPQENITFLL